MPSVFKTLASRDPDEQKRFFGCEGWEDEALDEFAEVLEKFPGGHWLSGHPPQMRRLYAMTCVKLQAEDAPAFEESIERGKAWLDYG